MLHYLEINYCEDLSRPENSMFFNDEISIIFKNE